MNTPTNLILENPGKFEQLDDQAAETFERVERNILPLLEKIISPFEIMNKERTGHSNLNRPNEEVLAQYDYGSMKVFVKTTPTTLKTNYKAVVDKTESFLKFVANDYLEGKNRKGLLTINQEAYIALNDIIDKIQEQKDVALEGKEGISQKVWSEAPAEVVREGLEKVVFKIGKDYSQPTPENAADYVRAATLKGEVMTEFYNKFLGELKARTGFSKDNLPSATVDDFVRVGNYLFPVQVVPKETVKYAKVIDALIKPFNKRITPSTGELIRLSKGLSDATLERYAPKARDGEVYVRLETIMERIREIKSDLTEPSCSYKIERSIKLD